MMSNNFSADDKKLINEKLLREDKTSIDVGKVIFEIWNNRSEKNKISELINILSKFIGEKRVFKEVEFFLPQLGHMVIHLESDWNNKTIERFLILISNVSVVSALQLTFILAAAMEDYQPENIHGIKNSNANPLLFFRCAKLLKNVELAVIFGSSQIQMTQPRQDSGIFLTNENSIRIVNKIVDGGNSSSLVTLKDQSYNNVSDTLLYKRVERKSMFSLKPWKTRHVTIDQRVLIIYHDRFSHFPLRTIPLQGCSLIIPEDAKYPFYFEVVNKSTDFRFLLRATSKASFDQWVAAINKEIHDIIVRIESLTTSDVTNEADVSIGSNASILSNLSEDQRKRFTFFEQQRLFVNALTDTSERLRFLDRDMRKFFLKRHMIDLVIPPLVFLPLCSTTDQFRCVLKTVPSHCYAFSTKARCPALMLFETEESPDHDNLSFLSTEISNYTINEIYESRNISIFDHISSPDTAISESDSDSKVITQEPSKLKKSSNVYNIWRDESLNVMKSSDSNPISLSDDHLAFNDISLQMTREQKRKIFLDSDPFAVKLDKIRSSSSYGHLPSWRLSGLIAKSNDDLRQEVFVMQMIETMKKIFIKEKVDVWIHIYRILSTSKSTGVIELITDATSLDGLKKKDSYPNSLRKYFEVCYGYTIAAEEPPLFKEAVMNFVKSMAGYSIVCYLLAIKDRHNGNVMIDSDGHIIHIDFGFVFGLAPGKAFSMERAPFKLTEELADVMGGIESEYFNMYRRLCCESFLAVRKHSQELMSLIEIMIHKSNFPAFRFNRRAKEDMMSRFHFNTPDPMVPALIDKLIDKSYKHTGTDLYDRFQLLTNGIAI